METKAKSSLKQSNSDNNDDTLSLKEAKQDFPMKYRCLTCDKGLDEASANHMDLEFPNLKKNKEHRGWRYKKKVDLKYIIELSLSIEVQDTRVICDECKNHFISFFEFKKKALKTLKGRDEDEEGFEVIGKCKECGATGEDVSYGEFAGFHAPQHYDESGKQLDRDGVIIEYIY